MIAATEPADPSSRAIFTCGAVAILAAAILGVGVLVASQVSRAGPLRIVAQWPTWSGTNAWEVVAISSDGKTVASGGSHDPLLLWDPGSGKPSLLDVNDFPP